MRALQWRGRSRRPHRPRRLTLPVVRPRDSRWRRGLVSDVQAATSTCTSTATSALPSTSVATSAIRLTSTASST